jgi:hypothetical protein
VSGVREVECAQVLSDFFASQRDSGPNPTIG